MKVFAAINFLFIVFSASAEQLALFEATSASMIVNDAYALDSNVEGDEVKVLLNFYQRKDKVELTHKSLMEILRIVKRERGVSDEQREEMIKEALLVALETVFLFQNNEDHYLIWVNRGYIVVAPAVHLVSDLYKRESGKEGLYHYGGLP